jgi:hypothetical protein
VVSVVVVVVDPGGAVRTSFVVVVAAVVVRAVLEDVMATVVLELPFRPALTRIAAIVTAARNAAGAPYRVSC